MNKVVYYLPFVLLLFCCQNNYEFRSIDDFDIVDDALQNNEKVRVLYFSRGPHDDKLDQGYYRHAVVQSIETNDTVNVLTLPNSDLDQLTSSDNILVFKNRPDVKSLTQNVEALSEDMKKMIGKVDTTKLSWPEYSLVASDPEFDDIAKNSHETVIGSLTKN